MLAGQKSQIEMSLREIDHAMEILESEPDDVVLYQTAGDILIKSEKNKTLESLKEKKDTLEVRLKTLNRQEERIQKRFTELQEQLKQSMGTAGGATTAQ